MPNTRMEMDGDLEMESLNKVKWTEPELRVMELEETEFNSLGGRFVPFGRGPLPLS